MAYWFSDNIISSDVDMTVDMYKYAGKIISERLTRLTEQQKYGEVQIVSMSLGGMVPPIVANEYKDFDCVTLVCSGSNLAKSLWHSDRTQDIRNTFEKNGITIDQLTKDWHDIEPINNIDAFVGKHVKIIVSKKDTSIPTVYQREYVAAVKNADVLLRVKESCLDHYGAIIWFVMRCYLFGKL